MFTVYIRFLSLSNFWMHLFQAWPIKCTYIHHTYQRASLDSESTVVLCYFALVASPGAFIDSGGFFQNWGPRPSILENWLAAHHDHGARCNAESISKASLFQNWGSGPSILENDHFPKKWPIKGAKTSGKCTNFFLQLANIYKIYILQKNWSKSTNPALSSGPNISLPLIWGHHHQLDDQHKEPMVNTKII